MQKARFRWQIIFIFDIWVYCWLFIVKRFSSAFQRRTNILLSRRSHYCFDEQFIAKNDLLYPYFFLFVKIKAEHIALLQMIIVQVIR